MAKFPALLGLVGLSFAGAGCAAAVDYRRWRALGVGGASSSVPGWIRITLLRAKKREPIGTSIYSARIGEPDDGSWLEPIPTRAGPRPECHPYPIPHRQKNQSGTSAAQRTAEQLFAATVKADPAHLEFRTSFFEKHNDAVSLKDWAGSHPVIEQAHGEVGHIHPSDGSMHMIFSPTDAVQVIEAGWGERHPLAGVLPGLPTTYLFIYSPRDEGETGVVGKLLEAATGYMVQAR